MLIADLFAGWGGAGQVFLERGHQVIGVDLVDRKPGYNVIIDDAFFHNVDAFDFVWASPPCNLYSVARGLTPEATRYSMTFKQPYIVENVPHGLANGQLLLCGTMFGLPFHKHRVFASSENLGMSPAGCDRTIPTRDMRFWSARQRNVLPAEYVHYLCDVVGL